MYTLIPFTNIMPIPIHTQHIHTTNNSSSIINADGYYIKSLKTNPHHHHHLKIKENQGFLSPAVKLNEGKRRRVRLTFNIYPLLIPFNLFQLLTKIQRPYPFKCINNVKTNISPLFPHILSLPTYPSQITNPFPILLLLHNQITRLNNK